MNDKVNEILLNVEELEQRIAPSATGNPGNNTFNGPGAGIAQGGYAGYSVMTGGPGSAANASSRSLTPGNIVWSRVNASL